MDAHTKLTILIASFVVIVVGVFLREIGDDSDSGDRAKVWAWLLMAVVAISIAVIIAKENPQGVAALGYTVIAFCGFGG